MNVMRPLDLSALTHHRQATMGSIKLPQNAIDKENTLAITLHWIPIRQQQPARQPRSRIITCSNGKYYGPQNALDSTLAWGDILTLTATEISSDRVPLSQAGILCAVLVLCWVGTATATGDYRYKAASNQVLFGQQQINMILAAINCSVTWIVFVPVALACYASMVSHSWMPKTTFMPSSQPGELPAQLEVLVASLFTISSWRGIYAGLRTYI